MLARVRRQTPNLLTVLRLLIAAAFFGALTGYRFPETSTLWADVAVALFLVAVFTDFLDGFLARRWHVESTFGRMMDPFCDKVLVIGAFIYLAGPHFAMSLAAGEPVVMATGIYPWMVVVILARELLVTTIRGSLEAMGESGAARLSGKLKMLLQSVTVPIVLVMAVHLQPRFPDAAGLFIARDVLVYATVIVTVWSGAPYVLAVRRMIARTESGRRSGGEAA